MLQKYCNYKNADFGILILRIAIGLVFIVHGYMKLTNMSGTMAFFGMLGIPAFMAYIVMIVELLGGILILSGFFVQFVGIALAIIMAVAIGTTSGGKGPFGGHELEMVLLFCNLAVAVLGAGKYSLQHMFKSGPAEITN